MSRHSGAVNWKLSTVVQSTACVYPLVAKIETHPAEPTYLIANNGDAAGDDVRFVRLSGLNHRLLLPLGVFGLLCLCAWHFLLG
eukprot:scaffold26556_cov114-Isochrysis_galbana.AAC.1